MTRKFTHLTVPLALAGALALGGCEGGTVALPPAVTSAAIRVEPALQQACVMAMSLAPAAPTIGVWIVPACGTAEAIVRLAGDPNSLEWVNQLIVKARADRKMPIRL